MHHECVSTVFAAGGSMEDNTQVPVSSTGFRQGRGTYSPARLVLLGDVRTLTETGSMSGFEGFADNSADMCLIIFSMNNTCMI